MVCHKDIETVMNDQTDLVMPVKRLKPSVWSRVRRPEGCSGLKVIKNFI